MPLEGLELTDAEKAALAGDVDALIAENPGLAGKSADSVYGTGKTDETPVKEDKPAAQTNGAAASDKPAVSADKTPKEEDDDFIPEELPDTKGGKRRMVDYRALKKRDATIGGLKEQVAKDAALKARLEERLNLLLAASTEQASEAEAAAAETGDEEEEDFVEMPDPQADIFGAFAALQKNFNVLSNRHNRQGEAVSETRQQLQSNAELEQLKQEFVNDSRQYRQVKPDLGEAYYYLLGKRGEQLKLQGVSDDRVNAALAAEEVDLVRTAKRMKKSPSELIYGLAQSMGYAPKAVNTATNGNGADSTSLAAQAAAVATNGSSSAAAHAQNGNGNGAEKEPSITEEIERIKRGQAASKSLGGGGGGSASTISLEDIANLPDSEFARLYGKHAKTIEALLSGRAT